MKRAAFVIVFVVAATVNGTSIGSGSTAHAQNNGPVNLTCNLSCVYGNAPNGRCSWVDHTYDVSIDIGASRVVVSGMTLGARFTDQDVSFGFTDGSTVTHGITINRSSLNIDESARFETLVSTYRGTCQRIQRQF